ncbi:hypothetical protein ACET3Z_013837 [Daucus carota]
MWDELAQCYHPIEPQCSQISLSINPSIFLSILISVFSPNYSPIDIYQIKKVNELKSSGLQWFTSNFI